MTILPVQGSRRRSRARGVIVTAGGPQMRGVLHDLALPTFRSYAAAWDWTVQAVDLPSDGSGVDAAAQQAKWAKPRLLQRALEEHPFALWIDADVLLLRRDGDVLAHLHPRDFQALALEHVPSEHRVNPNTGVWLLRSCLQSQAFLAAVTRAGQQPGPWADQGAVLHALGWERGDEAYRWAKPGRGNAFSAATSWLPPGWNAPYLENRTEASSFNSSAASYLDRPQVAEPHALHFMGMTAAARYDAMSATLLRDDRRLPA